MRVDPKKVRRLRERAELRTADTADMLDVSRPYASMMEAGAGRAL